MAAASVTGWERDGKTVRLVPVKPKVDEVLAEFRRGFEAALPKTSPLAELPVADLDATRAGELVLCGNPEAPCFRPSEDAFVNRLSAPSDRNHRMAMSNAKGCFRTAGRERALSWLFDDFLPGHNSYVIVSNVSNTKNKLSELLQQVRLGEEVVIVDRNRPVARLVGIDKDGEFEDESVAARAIRLGLATSAERAVRELPPLRSDDAPISLLDCLLADREESRY